LGCPNKISGKLPAKRKSGSHAVFPDHVPVHFQFEAEMKEGED
jgi:hypothetical protein